MFTKITVFAVFVACIIAVVSADSGERRVITVSAPRSGYRVKSYDDSNEDARYQFAYRLRAADPHPYGRGSAERSSELGHSETRNGDKTDGKYFIQLPDGRLQTVEYYVNGDSGYVAKVSYDGQSGEKRRAY